MEEQTKEQMMSMNPRIESKLDCGPGVGAMILYAQAQALEPVGLNRTEYLRQLSYLLVTLTDEYFPEGDEVPLTFSQFERVAKRIEAVAQEMRRVACGDAFRGDALDLT